MRSLKAEHFLENAERYIKPVREGTWTLTVAHTPLKRTRLPFRHSDFCFLYRKTSFIMKLVLTSRDLQAVLLYDTKTCLNTTSLCLIPAKLQVIFYQWLKENKFMYKEVITSYHIYSLCLPKYKYMTPHFEMALKWKVFHFLLMTN